MPLWKGGITILNLSISYYSDIGRRANNEDCVYVGQRNDKVLAVVCDGLGGMDDGEVASRMAVESILRNLPDREPDEDVLIDVIQNAGADILEAQQPDSLMLTTAAVVWLSEGTALAANVGDTRIYQFRAGREIFRSTDHSAAFLAVLTGKLAPEEIRTSPERNRLVRVLGDSPHTNVDLQPLEIRPGDRLLLCSDGFWEPVLERTMLDTIARSSTAEEWLTLMRQSVIAAHDPRQDNNTAVCIVVKDETQNRCR